MRKTLLICTTLLCLLFTNNVAEAQNSYTSNLLNWTITLPDEWKQTTRNSSIEEVITYRLDDENYIELRTQRLTQKDKQNLNAYRRAKLNFVEDNPELYGQLLGDSKDYKYRTNEYSEPIEGKRYQTIRINIIERGKKKLKVYVYQWDNDLISFDATIVCNNEQHRQIMRDAFANAVKSF